MTKEPRKRFAFTCAVLGKVMNASLSLAQGTGEFLGLKGGGRLARVGVKSSAMLAALALSVVSIGAGKAGTTQTAEPQAKTKAQTGKLGGVTLPPIKVQREAWQKAIVKTARPKKGCFTATYPEKRWREVKCTTPPKGLFLPRKGVRPFNVGNGMDFLGHVTGNTSEAEGSFDSVTGVTSESSGNGIANEFSLQLNTGFFPTATCSGAANPAACQGWEQFIFSNRGGSSGFVFIQYWLINYINGCPANWGTDGSGNCARNAAKSTALPAQTIAALGQMKLDGAIAGVNGNADDTVTLSIGGTLYSAPGDNILPELANGWQFTEFNVFGNGGSSQAVFNGGSSIVVRTAVNSGMPGTPPACVVGGTTAETNNLTLVSTPVVEPDVTWPSIIFTESNNAPTPESCSSADSIGDTHLKTFNGLLYDFQASGDFVLASAPDFVVQTRQASGAPTWPNASINKAVATQMGKTRVALYIEPTRLMVDGRASDLADGRTLELPGGVQVTRQGDTYAIMSEKGDSVRAVLNTTWMDVTVGLGRSPEPLARGLLGNPNGNVRELATSKGVVLRAPVAFVDLYHSYADSWRVQPNESLFTEETTIRPGIPDKLFFANHLNPQDRARALAICKAARITNKTLLDACTLDTVVLNDEAAARVFVHAPPPRAVIKPVLRESVLHPTP